MLGLRKHIKRRAMIEKLRRLDDRLLHDFGIPRHAIGEVVDGLLKIRRR